MANRLALVTLGVALLLGGAVPAIAQDDPKVGVFATYPGTAGIVWRLTDAVTVRPDVQFSWNRFTSLSSGLSFNGVLVSSSETRSTNRSIGAGVSALVTVARWDRLRAYVVPRVEYVWLTETREEFDTTPAGSNSFGISSSQDVEPKRTDGGRSYATSGSFGAEYGVGQRFSVFGEVGAEYSSLKYPGTLSGAEGKSFTMRSNVGVIFWF